MISSCDMVSCYQIAAPAAPGVESRRGPQRRGREGAQMPTVSFKLNGAPAIVRYEEGTHLLEVLREQCGITSPKDGCAPQGFCGCCTVLVDGHPALACQKRPEDVAGHEIVTLEGISEERRRLLSRAFVQEGAIQCGFCTPGIMLRAVSVLERGRGRDREAVGRALSAHLCRCTGYARIFDAISRAAETWDTGAEPTAEGPSRPVVFADGHEPDPTGVGANASRYRGVEYALGAKPFIADMRADGMLHGAVVLSAHPRARVLAIDVAPALASPGAVRVLTASDVPGERLVGTIVRDWPVFVAPGEITRCVGDVLALVLADSQLHARRAAALVRVEYEVLAPVTSPEEALRPGAPSLHAAGNVLEMCAFSRGDVNAALAAAAHVVTQRFQTQRIEHAFLEPEACLAILHPADPGAGERGPGTGTVKVYSQGQGVHEDQVQIASVLAVPREAVEVELVATGGAFGGKEDLSIQAQTALAAVLTGRPVRTVLTREQSILMHPKRHPLTLDYTAGCDAEGRLTAVRARIIGDTGAYASVGAKVLERAAGHSCGPYRVPNVDVEATTVYTNNPPSGAMRGFGANQAAFAIEGVLDLLAAKVGLDGYDIRERNVLGPGDRFATGQIMTSACGVRATLEAVRDVYKAASRAGIACGIKNTGIGNGLKDIGRVLLRVEPGPHLAVITGFSEMGQGLFTILRQVVAEETGLDAETMDVTTRSDLAVECGMTTASRATALATMAAQRAARALAADLAGAPLASLVGREYHGEHVCDFTVAPGSATDNPVTHVTFGYATQVVILGEDGRVARVVAAHDVGRAINPLQCVTQIEGAIHMGLGYALSEELACVAGRPVSTLLRDLGIVKAKDVPEIDVILVEVSDPVGGYGAKGVGEIGLVPTAGAVAGALAAFDGIRRTALPMSDAPAARPSVPASRRSR
jgi:selenium-dependent xanthine dehydrogenase